VTFASLSARLAEAERLLTEARHTIRVHETGGVEQDLTAAPEDLEAERLLRLAAARERDQAILGRQAAENRLRLAKEMRKTAGQPTRALG
jgi:hypothetical protein